MGEKVVIGSVHIENYGNLTRVSFWGCLDKRAFINREDAKKIAEVLERFAKTGRVDDDAERTEEPRG